MHWIYKNELNTWVCCSLRHPPAHIRYSPLHDFSTQYQIDLTAGSRSKVEDLLFTYFNAHKNDFLKTKLINTNKLKLYFYENTLVSVQEQRAQLQRLAKNTVKNCIFPTHYLGLSRWKKINSWRDGVTTGLLWDLDNAWRIFVCLFFVFLIFFTFCGILYRLLTSRSDPK